MFYIIERTYVGPNPTHDKFIDASTVVISTEPARTNCSREIRIMGWCGTTNDWAVHAHGEFSTFDAAKAAILAKFGEMRDLKSDGEPFDKIDQFVDNIVAVFKPGKFEPFSKEAVANWAGDLSFVDANTTDQRLAELADECEVNANDNGFTVKKYILDVMKEHRDFLRGQNE